MPIYKLQIAGTDSGKLQVTNANNTISWSYKAPSGNGFTTMATQPTYTGTPMTPAVGDTLNLSACTDSITNPPANTATYAAANQPTSKAGYFYTAPVSIKNSSPGSWDAEDTGGDR